MFRWCVLTVCVLHVLPNESITVRDNYLPRTKPNLDTNWEEGLREAAYQALLRERFTTDNLRERLLEAPVVGRANKPTPFGDIAVLARGQLYTSRTGFLFVQDTPSHCCNGCHPSQCRTWKPHSQERLLALWTVKRLRHHDVHYGHRYEMEYTISPISAAIREEFVTRNGGFDYSVPGHVFIVKTESPIVDHRKESRFFDGDLHAGYEQKTAQWRGQYPAIEYLPVDKSRNYDRKQNSDGDTFQAQQPDNGYKHLVYDVPSFLGKPEEHDVYRNFIETLARKTSTVGYPKPTLPKPPFIHRENIDHHYHQKPIHQITTAELTTRLFTPSYEEIPRPAYKTKETTYDTKTIKGETTKPTYLQRPNFAEINTTPYKIKQLETTSIHSSTTKLDARNTIEKSFQRPSEITSDHPYTTSTTEIRTTKSKSTIPMSTNPYEKLQPKKLSSTEYNTKSAARQTTEKSFHTKTSALRPIMDSTTPLTEARTKSEARDATEQSFHTKYTATTQISSKSSEIHHLDSATSTKISQTEIITIPEAIDITTTKKYPDLTQISTKSYEDIATPTTLTSTEIRTKSNAGDATESPVYIKIPALTHITTKAYKINRTGTIAPMETRTKSITRDRTPIYEKYPALTKKYTKPFEIRHLGTTSNKSRKSGARPKYPILTRLNTTPNDFELTSQIIDVTIAPKVTTHTIQTQMHFFAAEPETREEIEDALPESEPQNEPDSVKAQLPSPVDIEGMNENKDITRSSKTNITASRKQASTKASSITQKTGTVHSTVPANNEVLLTTITYAPTNKRTNILTTLKNPTTTVGMHSNKKKPAASAEDDEELNIFGEEPTAAAKSEETTHKIIHSPDIDDIFGEPQAKQKSKIIYSNFFEAATPELSIEATNIYPQTEDFSNETADDPEASTRRSILTSISFEVNKREKSTTIPVEIGTPIQAKISEILMNNTNIKVFKAEMPDSVESTEGTPIAKSKVFDHLALMLVNHAKSIDILNSQPTRQKIKRKVYVTRTKRIKQKE